MNSGQHNETGFEWGSILLIIICSLSIIGLIISSVLAFSFSKTSQSRGTQLAVLEESYQSLETQAAALEGTQKALRTEAADLYHHLNEEEISRATAEALSEMYMESAEQYADISKGNRLAADAISVYEDSPPLGLLLSIEAANATIGSDGFPSTKAEEALRKILAKTGGTSLIGHDQAVNDVVLSSDNHWLFSGSRDGTIRMWDLLSENPSAAPYLLSCLGDEQEMVEISPDNEWLATGGMPGSLCLWNLQKEVINSDPIILSSHPATLRSIKFNQDSDLLFSADSIGNLRIWDLTDLDSPSLSFEYALSEETISDADISEDFDRIIATTNDGQIHLISVEPTESSRYLLNCPIDWPYLASISSIHSMATVAGDMKICVYDLRDLNTPPIVLTEHEENIRDVSLSPNGEWLITTSADNLAYLWTMQDLTNPAFIHSRHENPIIDLVFTHDSQQLITAGGDGRIYILDLTSPDPTQNIQNLLAHDDPIYSIDISEDSKWLVSGGLSGVIRLWNFENPMADPWVVTKERSRSLAISPDSHWLVTSHDTLLQIWDLTQPAAPPISYDGFTNSILSAAFSSSGEILAVGSWDETFQLWTTFDPNHLSAPSILEAGNGITLVSVSPSSRWVLFNVGDRSDTYIIDLQSSDPTPKLIGGLNDDLVSVAFCPNENWLIAGTTHGSIVMWDLTLNDPFSQAKVIGSVRLSVDELIFSNDSQYLIAQERDTLLLWDLSSENPSWIPISLEGHVGHLTDVALSSDNQWIAASSIHDPIAVWKFDDPGIIRYTMHHWGVDRIAFSPDGHWLASGGQDNLIRLWNMYSEQPALSPIVMEGHEDMIYALSFTPNGDWLITASSDSVRAWSMSLDNLLSRACEIAGRNLTIDEWQVYLGEDPYRTTCSQYPAAIPVSYEPTPIP
jgi:WD40 repeat protein